MFIILRWNPPLHVSMMYGFGSLIVLSVVTTLVMMKPEISRLEDARFLEAYFNNQNALSLNVQELTLKAVTYNGNFHYQLNNRSDQFKSNGRKIDNNIKDIKVPFPIFVPSLPKSGTTTVHKYFKCGKQKSAHLFGKNRKKIGKCAQENVAMGKAPFEACGDFDVWTDTGYVNRRYMKKKPLKKSVSHLECFYPLIDALEEVYENYPRATILFVIRNVDDWLNSIQHFQDGYIMEAWKRCNTTGFPGIEGTTIEDFRKLYNWHKQFIQNFAKEHPSLTYIEVELEAPETASILKNRTGIPARCWGHHNVNRMKPLLSTGTK